MVDATSDGPARISGRREEIVLMFTRTPAIEFDARSRSMRNAVAPRRHREREIR